MIHDDSDYPSPLSIFLLIVGHTRLAHAEMRYKIERSRQKTYGNARSFCYETMGHVETTVRLLQPAIFCQVSANMSSLAMLAKGLFFICEYLPTSFLRWAPRIVDCGS